jgi:hypothetical protein
MKLTKSELNRLRNFQRARERAPTALYGLWRVKWHILTLSILFAIGFLLPESPIFSYFILGLGGGVLLCLCIVAFILPRFWPLTREIMDWDRVAQLLKEHDDNTV